MPLPAYKVGIAFMAPAETLGFESLWCANHASCVHSTSRFRWTAGGGIPGTPSG